MKVGKWVLGIAVLSLVLGSLAEAQTFDANTLCLNGGSGYTIKGARWNYPNNAVSKYFPSFAHIPATSVNQAGIIFPWKLAGWGWTGEMGANNYAPTWYWKTALQASYDNPYMSGMSFDYPLLFCNGTVTHGGAPAIYGGLIPSYVPIVGNLQFQHPSSMGGMSGYLNIFAAAGASWMIPSTVPGTDYSFGFFFGNGCASAITVPSSASIWEVVWTRQSPYSQYLIYSCELDANGAAWAGNKGRNYTIMNDGDNGLLWYWGNGCNGTGEEVDYALFLCDAITIPVNVSGAWWGQPYTGYGFDTGIACLTPFLSGGNADLGFQTQDYTGQGGTRVVLAAFGSGAWGPYGKQNNRLPHGWDVLSNLFVNMALVFGHTPAAGYPAPMYGTTIGAHSTIIPFPAEPLLMCAEIMYSTYAVGATPGYSPPCSAGIRVTYF